MLTTDERHVASELPTQYTQSCNHATVQSMWQPLSAFDNPMWCTEVRALNVVAHIYVEQSLITSLLFMCQKCMHAKRAAFNSAARMLSK